MKSKSSSIKHAIYVKCIFIMNIYKFSITNATCKIVFPLRKYTSFKCFSIPPISLFIQFLNCILVLLVYRIGILLLGFSINGQSLLLVRDYATEIELLFVYYRFIIYDTKQRKYIKKQKIVLVCIKRMLGQTFQWQFGQSFRSNHYTAHPLII